MDNREIPGPPEKVSRDVGAKFAGKRSPNLDRRPQDFCSLRHSPGGVRALSEALTEAPLAQGHAEQPAMGMQDEPIEKDGA